MELNKELGKYREAILVLVVNSPIVSGGPPLIAAVSVRSSYFVSAPINNL